MSDYFKNESYLRGANNDGMDPYWKPNLKSEKIETIDNITELFNLLDGICERFKKYSVEDLEKLNIDGMVLRITFHSDEIIKMRNIIGKFRSKKDPAP